MKKQALLAALFLTTALVPAAMAADWWEGGKYEAGHHFTWDEWKEHRMAWEAEHKHEKHWDDAHMKREWESHKAHFHY